MHWEARLRYMVGVRGRQEAECVNVRAAGGALRCPAWQDQDDATEGASLPPWVLALIVEWASLHEAELLANWARCRRGETPLRIPPLE